MPTLFQSSRLKLDRARYHIQAAEQLISEHFASDWYTAEFKQGGAGDYSLSVKFRGPPKTLSAIVGDAVHNLRAALDLLAVRLVELANHETKDVMFPFSKDAASFAAMLARRNLHHASQADQQALAQLQPYHGGNVDLRALHDLDIQDKHRDLIPETTFLTTPEIRIRTDSEGKPIGFETGKLEAEMVSGSKATGELRFPEGFPLAQQPLLPGLTRLADMVDGILNAFDAIERA